MNATVTDESWPMIEEAVFRLFDEIAGKGAEEHTAVGAALAELGWSDIEAEYPIEACELLFRAQGRSLAHTDILNTVMLAELTRCWTAPSTASCCPASPTATHRAPTLNASPE